MKIVKNIALGLIILVLISASVLYSTGNGFIFTSIKRTYLAGEVTANINDHAEFENNVKRWEPRHS